MQKLRLQQQLQGELLSWAQTRFWIIAIVSIMVGIFGVRSLVREMLSSELKDATRASADAQAAANQGRDAVKEVRAEAAQYRDLVHELTGTANDVDKELKELRSRIDAEGTRSVAAADLKFAVLDQQIAELRDMVRGLAESSQRLALVETSEQRLAEVRKSAASSEAAFEANSSYKAVVVHHGPGSKTEAIAGEIVNALSKMGFRASQKQWVEGMWPRDFVKISYRHQAKEKVGVVHSVVVDALRSNAYPVEQVIESEETFEERYHFRIFL